MALDVFLHEYCCSGENVSIRAIRGMLAISVLFAVFFDILLNVIFAPARESSLSPVKSFRPTGLTQFDLQVGINPAAWAVTYVRLKWILSFDVIVY